MKVVSIDTPDGNVSVNSDELFNLNKEAQRILAEIDVLKAEYKDIVSEASDKTKLKKGTLSKYFVARFKFETKKFGQEGDLFETLDDLLDN